jgi:hypothetical protein
VSRAARICGACAAVALVAALTGSARAQTGDPPAPERAISLHAAAGLGVGTLAFTLPTAQGVQRLPDTPFPAVELALRVHAVPRARVSLETLLAYQSSLGLELLLEPQFSLPERVDVRAHRLELSFAPVLRLFAKDGDVALAFPIGFAFHAFVPESHQYPTLAVHAFGGPQLRTELWLKLGELVRLRIGPELQWIVLVDGAMRGEGACCQGLAVGGQGVLEASVGPVFRVAFAYRESRTFVPVVSRFEGVERFLTARIAGEL